jgi:hypothetical protein
MTGKARRVSRIVRTVVDFFGFRKARAINKEESEQCNADGSQRA